MTEALKASRCRDFKIGKGVVGTLIWRRRHADRHADGQWGSAAVNDPDPIVTPFRGAIHDPDGRW